jgi:hypothetical protein
MSQDPKKVNDERVGAPNLDFHFDYCEPTFSTIQKKHFEDA